MAFLDKYTDRSYALMRIVAGFLFLWHGSQKLFNYPTDFKYDLSPLIYAAGVIELIGGVLVMIGFYTRHAAFICSGTMAVAYWMAHGTNNIFPLLNRGELATMYCFVFLYIACKGSGVWSLDKK